MEEAIVTVIDVKVKEQLDAFEKLSSKITDKSLLVAIEKKKDELNKIIVK